MVLLPTLHRAGPTQHPRQSQPHKGIASICQRHLEQHATDSNHLLIRGGVGSLLKDVLDEQVPELGLP
jgi:hypothetical protein